MIKLARLTSIASSATLFFSIAKNALAQTATISAPKGGTDGSLPGAGSTELTYFLFMGGVLLFVFGMLKLILSYQEKV
ncbi:hypothetical protein A2165_01890 [Candidatus Curtissbacteria bacterium RBG_13_40_7]|uniref:Gram-positive cocci surface proteins LPxTG domain-containing protein n=1 Tax=Candidatus Curtissbacteria bacterium RBG_13_40_7 TaxID=1797706 RepID=A0A1F5FWR4_9BACT|nr:MAG: hypothetical protein A2165_01890 [Candidatus Curtissbacteria bacterium RBG_13_40_7]